MQPREVTNGPVSRDAVLEQVSRITASAQFAASARLSAVLRYVVKQTVDGRAEDIKEYTIALEVFGRPESFDPRLDTIVRVQASKVRAKLKEYYAGEGARDAVLIDLPRGTYVPVFHSNDPPSEPAGPGRRRIKVQIVAALMLGAIVLVWPLVRFVNMPAVVQRRSPSVAVLPFADMSPNKDQEYFCDGITEELINALAKIDGLHVVARTSAFEFKGKGLDVRKIGAQLNVQTVLEGSVRREDDKLRITAQLYDVPDGYRLWSAAYDRPANGVFVVQEEIARAVVNALRVKLRAPGKPLAKQYTGNVEVHNLYLLGQYHLNRRPAQGEVNSAISFFEKVIAADPSYAPAYAALAFAYLQLVVWDHRPPRQVIPLAKEYITKALAIDDDLGEAHATRAAIAAAYDYDQRTAFSESQRALDLTPGASHAHLWRSVLLDASGRLEDAFAELKTAADLDPLSIGIGSDLGRLLIRRGEYARGMEQFQKMLGLDPNSIRVLSYMADALQQKGLHAEAIAALEKASNISPDYPRTMGLLGHAYAVAGNRSAALQVLDRLNKLGAQQYVPPVDIAVVYAGLGDKHQAFQWLEQAYGERYPLYLYFMVTHAFDPLRSDPRFGTLMKKLGW
jgi:TolB-like protein/Tfp pilus assembly protein PilF